MNKIINYIRISHRRQIKLFIFSYNPRYPFCKEKIYKFLHFNERRNIQEARDAPRINTHLTYCVNASISV